MPASAQRAQPRRERRAAERSAHRPSGWARPASRCARRHAAASRSSSRSTSLSKRGETSWIDASRRRCGRWSCCAYVRQRRLPRQSINKASLEVHGTRPAFDRPMRIVDVCAFYTPAGGGVRTYVEAKLRAAARFGHEMIVIAPGERRRGRSSADPARSSSPFPRRTLPVDRRYRYFDDETALHAALDAWQPGPCRSFVALVERDDGRPLAGAGDALARHAFRSARGLCLSLARRVCAAIARSIAGSAGSGATCAASGRCSTRWFAPTASSPSGCARAVSRTPRRSDGRRAGPVLAALDRRRCARRRWPRSGSIPTRILLVGVGRFSAEKRWDMVLRAVGECRRRRPVGLLLVGDGPGGASSSCSRTGLPDVAVLPRLPTVTSSPRCSRAPTRWSMAARPRPSAWLRPRRAQAASR